MGRGDLLMEEKRLCISITDEEHWAIIAGLQMLGDIDKNPYLTEEQWECIQSVIGKIEDAIY
jgi:hypothetical protein